MTNTIIRVSCAFLLLIIFENCVLSADKALLQDSSASSYAKQHAIIKEGNVFDVDNLIQEARNCYLDKKYSQAKEKYLKAVSILSRTSATSTSVQAKISYIKESLVYVYTAWSQDLLLEAEKEANVGKAEKAISLCSQAIEMNPACKDLANKLIQKYSDAKNNIQYQISASDEKVNPGYKDKLYKVDVLYEQGKALYNKKLYTQAKEKFQELLLLDPYNLNAIEYTRLINGEIIKAGDYRTQMTSIERKAETEWEKLSPVISKTLTGDRVDLMEDQPIRKSDELSVVNEKLNNIVIKSINFEEVPIDTALLYLKTESQKADPTGKGVNFFLRLEPQVQNQQVGKTEEIGANATEDTSQQKEKVNPANQYLVTIVLDNVPLGKAVDYICKAVGLKYKINRYVIEVFSPNIQFNDFDTQILPVEKEVFSQAKNETTDLKDYFVERGITFGEGATAVYDPKISRLIVRNSQTEIQKIKRVLDEVEKRLPQVSIAAKFVEMGQTDFDELGFEWRMSRTGRSDVNWDQNDLINQFGTNDREFGFAYTNAGFNLESTLHALQQNKRTEVLSAPKVTTLSGHKAVIRLITDEIYPTGWNPGTQTTLSDASGVGSSSYVIIGANPIVSANETTPIGVMLTVLPMVSADNYTIDLNLEPVVQDFKGWVDYSPSPENDPQGLYQGMIMPEITARTIQTSLKVSDGETVVMGGVLKDTTEKINDSIPILGDIPLVGRLFQSEIESADKTNLLIFTTVQLIRPDGTLLRPSKYDGLPTFQ